MNRVDWKLLAFWLVVLVALAVVWGLIAAAVVNLVSQAA